YLGAHIVAIRIEALSFLPGFAMSLAAATLMGQWLGAGDSRTAGRATLLCSGIASAFMGAMGLVFMLRPAPVVALFTSQQAHLEMTPRLI
ncbi:MATE family efflux transporter, partial [Acinetobacter baumannii]